MSERAQSTVPGKGVEAASDDQVVHLAIMREMRGFQLGEKRTDVRHWPVFTSDSRLVGSIDRLMVETATRKVRYACVTLVPHAGNDRRPSRVGNVLVPIGLMRRVDDRNIVVVDELSSESLVNAPRLRVRPITRGDEKASLAAYGVPAPHESTTGFYANPVFAEDRLLLAAG